jgi:mannose-6-phosphate isomerase-like protein (cupin superfamily)
VDPSVVASGEGERHTLGASVVAIKAGSEQTAGSFYCGEVALEPGFPGPPPHVHDKLHDMFYVLEGELSMRLGEEDRIVGPGTFVCVPPGVVHTFSNPGPAVVRFLNFNTPGGWEGYMRELGAAASGGRQLSSQEIGEIASRYDFRLA